MRVKKVHGRMLNAMPVGASEATAAQAGPSGSGDPTQANDLVTRSGPVMHSPTTYLIFWNPPGSTIDSGLESAQQQFQTDLGGNYYGILSQYYDSVGNIEPQIHFGGSWTDTQNTYPLHPYPTPEPGGPPAPTAGSQADPLLDSDIQDEVTRAVNANPYWQAPGLSTLYEVVMGTGIEWCDGSGTCSFAPSSGGGFDCAYHGSFSVNGVDVVYANISNVHCDSPKGSRGLVDTSVSVASHETFEAISDPVGGGWRSPQGDEIGDLCNFHYGPTVGSDNADLVLNGHGYYVQQEWSNLASDAAAPGTSFSGCTLPSGAVEPGPGGASGTPGGAAASHCSDNALPPNDDGSTGQVSLPFPVNFFSKTFNSLWVNNNGNVTFDAPLRTFTPFGLLSTSSEIIAPFFADVDTRGSSNVVTYGSGPIDSAGNPAYFCVNWSNVGYYSQHDEKANSFQLLLVDRSAQTGTPGDFDIVFNYDKIQWETGDASGGAGGLGGTPAVAGYSNGSTQALQLPGSASTGAFLDGGYDSLIQGGTGSSTPGRYIFQVRNGATPNGGTLHGTVTDGGGNLVVGAAVQICGSSYACSFTQTNIHGVYSLTGLAPDTYAVQVNPPAGSSLLTGYSSATLAGSSVATDDITLGNLLSLPSSVSLTYHRVTADGVPVLEWGGHDTLSYSGCPAGTVRGSIETTDAAARNNGASLSESFLVPEIVPIGVHTGEYQGNIPDPNPGVGPATITLVVTCPDTSLNQTLRFTVYIDPSGSVLDQAGHPVNGATVTLLRSDSPSGPFLPVPNGSALMSAGNRANPDTTTADGTFGWDVLTGYYRVQASKTGCTNPADPTSDTVTSQSFPVPPPVTQLHLVLHCPNVTDTTAVTYTGPASGDTHDPLVVSGHLSDTTTTQPVPAATITLTFADQTCTATTDTAGNASCTLTPTAASGPATAHADFAGTNSLAPSTSTATPVTVTAEETTLTLQPATAIASGRPATLTATLTEDTTTALPTRTVTFTLGSGTTAQTCAGSTDTTGQASCTLTVNQVGGPTTVTAAFAGDGYDKPASTQTPATVFTYLTAGGFVVADGNRTVGSTVTFWGAQWCAKNGVSGSCPSAFKGYADSTTTTPYAVGGTWTSRPGASGNPPATLPTYMAVLTTQTVTKSGSNITGTVTHVIIVKVNPGYANSPGSAGTGTIVGQIS